MLIARKRATGAFGTVSVAYATLGPSESYPFLPPLDPTRRRADYDDYDFVSGVVTLVPGQRDVVVNVSIKGTDHSRAESVVFLRLNYVSLAQPQQLRHGLHSSPYLHNIISVQCNRSRSKVKYTSICTAHFYAKRLKCAQTWITQFYLQITPCLPLLPSRRTSPPFGWYSFYRPTKGRRLSRPGWLVTYRNKVPPPGVEPGHGHPSQY